jgi:hypothetical protein
VLDCRGIARVLDTLRQPLRNPKPPLDLPQQKRTGVGGQPATVEGDVNRLATD